MTEIQPEIIDIGKLGDTPVISLNKDSSTSKSTDNYDIKDKPSVNFGSGIELLMNNKLKDSKEPSADIDLGDLNNLEKELNDLSQDTSYKAPSKSGLFNKKSDSDPIKLNISEESSPPESSNMANIGKATVEASKDANTNNKTWDGFSKFNNIPLDPDKQVPAQPKLSQEELLREKFKYLRKLEELESKGVKLSKKYTMESPLMEMQGEYEMIIADKERVASCKFQGRMLMAAVTGLEFLNNRFDPFDVKLDGWAEQINENMEDYDEIFGELHEKYKSKAKMAPELKLLFQLGGSAIMVHMTNTMFKASLPGMDDIMKQNPELMQQFTQAAVGSMGDSNPGFGNFMNNFMPSSNNNRPLDPMPNTNLGQPPPPVNTQAQRTERYGPPPSRPDLMSNQTQHGISIEEKFADYKSERPKRPEMQGPENISNILSGLKTKQVNIPTEEAKKDDSTISIQDLKELTSQKVPKSNRKAKSGSAKNTVSLDL